MGKIVNLRRVRKRRDRRRKDAKAAENRILFGLTKADRLSSEAEQRKADHGLEAHRIARPEDHPSK
jgi:Domain of unknown function (DUF4169)